MRQVMIVSPVMPSFGKKQSKEAKKRFDHQMYLAQASPDEVFDVSGCELHEVPNAVFSLCKVYQKHHLRLNDNKLKSFDGGGRLRELSHLTYLDVSSNSIRYLPQEIACLSLLRVLDLHNNNLIQIPDCIASLRSLDHLNLEGNQLTDLPEALSQLKKLRVLRLAGNPIQRLPMHIRHLTYLETLALPMDSLSYPPQDVCSAGAQAVVRKLCEDAGEEYIPVDEFDGTSSAATATPTNVAVCQPSKVEFKEDAIKSYERMQEEKRKRVLDLERHQEESLRAHARLASEASQFRRTTFEKMAEEEAKTLQELRALQVQRDEERCNLVAGLKDTEQGAELLVRKMLAANEAAKRREAILEAAELSEYANMDWQIESAALRRAEILDAMRKTLSDTADVLRRHNSRRELIKQQTLSKEADANRAIAEKLATRRVDETDLVAQLNLEQSAQKEAFAQLQRQRDNRSQRLVCEIDLIGEELCRLTQAEQARTEERAAAGTRLLEERRTSLLKLLTQLLKEKEFREDQLKQRLAELELHREQNQIDFWLVQYQHLMDKKPTQLIHKENALEAAVYSILREAEALDFQTNFERHNIDMTTLEKMTDEELTQIGIYALGARKRILAIISKHLAEKKLQPTVTGSTSHAMPTAPYLTEASAPCEPSAPSDVVARIETECCICTEAPSSIIFLPCGHVCCCRQCSSQVILCPLCRSSVIQRILLQSQ